MALVCSTTSADDSVDGYSPTIAFASRSAELAIRQFKLPEGFTVELAAAEPELANPVAFAIDEQGRVYVAETFRQQRGVEDNRYHMAWLEDDLAAQTVADRLAFFHKHLGDEVAKYGIEHDRIRLLDDRDGDGRYETATVFADGFNDIVDGTGAGVLARRGDVYYTCIPKLWLLRDDNGDGRADTRQALHDGYGVRVAFRGHDMHGLRFGPDGWLYFSIGDRGYHVETEGRTLSRPDTGAVFRCRPDGSELEVFAYGLRNPQELAFNEYGDLFTVDNNSDSEDQARIVHVVEGGDSGWRMYFQYLADRGPWNRDLRWRPRGANADSSIAPPVANLSDGPSGLAYDPGTGLPAAYRGRFFLCDFRGTNTMSGIRSFRVEREGATYSLAGDDQFLWNILATDVDFGFDGSMYVSDWVEGWEGAGKGRIYRVTHESATVDPEVEHVRRLFAEGFVAREPSELIGLLSHRDMRVRQEAQFALAERGSKSIGALSEVARISGSRLARLHAMWGLGQIARADATALDVVAVLFSDSDAEIRRLAARLSGDHRLRSAIEPLIALVGDASPRVRFEAAMSLGKLGDGRSLGPLIELLRDNDDRDPYLRHAAVMGLAGAASVEELIAVASDSSPAVRRGALLALRRLESRQVLRFLGDDDPSIVADAARAIYDTPIEPAYAALAALVARGEAISEPALSRAIAAAYELATAEHAAALAQLAVRDDVSEPLRVAAIEALAAWHSDAKLDRLNGRFRRRAPGHKADARAAASGVMPRLLTAPAAVQTAAARLAAALSIAEASPRLAELVADASAPVAVRVAAVQALDTLHDERLASAAQQAATSAEPELRGEALRILARLRPDEAAPLLAGVLATGALVEKRAALATAADIEHPAADALLAAWIDRLLEGDVPRALELDLLEAASRRNVSPVAERLAAFEAARSKDDPLAAYEETLYGGDAERGRTLFFEKAELSCVRCHKVEGRGGEVGPDLSDAGRRLSRADLLEALILPSAKIAKGFETAVVLTTDGQAIVGIVREEDERELRMVTQDAKFVRIPKDAIDERASGQSAMPDTLVKFTSKSDVRDLIQYLSKQATPPIAHP